MHGSWNFGPDPMGGMEEMGGRSSVLVDLLQVIDFHEVFVGVFRWETWCLEHFCCRCFGERWWVLIYRNPPNIILI